MRRREPEVALAFTPDPWVEDLHRHCSDHGGARIRAVVVDGAVALEESYDVLVAGHRWLALTRAFVADTHARGRSILGIYDREEPAGRKHLVALGVDAVIESDAGCDGFVRAIVTIAGHRDERVVVPPSAADTRLGRLVTVGGPPGTGRTEIVVQLGIATARRSHAVIVDADDVAPSVAQRLHLPIDPSVRSAIDAVEHGRGDLGACVLRDARFACGVVAGVPNPTGWTQIRPGEIMRVVDRIADTADVVIADGAGVLEDVGGSHGRSRYATARAIVAGADVIVAVCDASPQGVARVLAWTVEARMLAVDAPLVVVVNRAPASRFRRNELYDELIDAVGPSGVAFVPYDRRVGTAAWNGAPVGTGPFTRAVDHLAGILDTLPARTRQSAPLEEAS